MLVLFGWLLLIPVCAQEGDFEVRSGSALPAGWVGGPDRSGGRRYEAHRKGENPGLWGQVDIMVESPTTLEQLKANERPHSDRARVSWETGQWRGYTVYIYRQHEVIESPNYQGSVLETDLYYVALNDQIWARISLERSCSLGRVLMQDGSELPADTVAMPYEVKFVPVDGQGEVAGLRGEQEAILQTLEFELGLDQDQDQDQAQDRGQDRAPPSGGEIPWGTLVGLGVAGIVAVALAAMTRKQNPATAPKSPKKSPAPGPKSPEKPGPPEVFVLQLSADQLEVGPAEPSVLTARVWRVDPKTGTYRSVPEAVIEVVPPVEVGVDLQAAPGMLTCRLTLVASEPCASASLVVRAQAGGSLHQATVQLQLRQPVSMEFF